MFLKKVVKTLNNKGQSLVTFVMLLPIIIILLAIVVDVGNLAYTKHKYETEIQSTIKYGLRNLKDDNIKQKMETMLETNIKGSKTVNVDNGVIRINVKDKVKGIFISIVGNGYDLDITYNSYVNDGKMQIIKE